MGHASSETSPRTQVRQKKSWHCSLCCVMLRVPQRLRLVEVGLLGLLSPAPPSPPCFLHFPHFYFILFSQRRSLSFPTFFPSFGANVTLAVFSRHAKTIWWESTTSYFWGMSLQAICLLKRLFPAQSETGTFELRIAAKMSVFPGGLLTPESQHMCFSVCVSSPSFL